MRRKENKPKVETQIKYIINKKAGTKIVIEKFKYFVSISEVDSYWCEELKGVTETEVCTFYIDHGDIDAVISGLRKCKKKVSNGQ